MVINTSGKFEKDVQATLLKGDYITRVLFVTAQIKYTVPRDSSILSTDKFLLSKQIKSLPLQLLDAQCLEIMGKASALRKECHGVHSVWA